MTLLDSTPSRQAAEPQRFFPAPLRLCVSAFNWVCLFISLAACTAPPTAEPTITPRPTPTLLSIHLPTDLLFLTEPLAACAPADTGLLFFEAHIPPLPEGAHTLTLWLGQPPEGVFAAGLGLERISFIVNAQNPLESLTPGEARKIFSGEQGTWGDGTPVEVWLPLEGSAARQIFDQVFLSLPVSPEAYLSPSPAAAVEAVAANEGAIALIPEGWLTPAVKAVGPLADLPVLALTDGEPQGVLRVFVGCLQGAGVTGRE